MILFRVRISVYCAIIQLVKCQVQTSTYPTALLDVLSLPRYAPGYSAVDVFQGGIQ